MWRLLSSVFNYVNGQTNRTFETRKLSLDEDTASSSSTASWRADVSKISDRLLVGCNTPPSDDGPAVDALDFCNARLLPGFWRAFELPPTGHALLSLTEVVTIAKDATKYMLGAPVNIAVILGSSAESSEALALVCCCIIVLRAAAKDGREAFALYASQRYVEPIPRAEEVLHASSLRQLELLSRKAQFLTEEESKPAKEWAVASVSVSNIPDWLENINVSMVNLYGEKSLVLERQNLLRNQQRMGASASWKDEEMPIVKGEVYIVAEKCIVNPGEVQEPRLFGAYGCLLPESPHLQKMLASSSGAHYLDLSIDQCDVFDSRLENTGIVLSVLLRPVDEYTPQSTAAPFPPSPEEIGDFLELPSQQNS
ncbi:hypothetical protein FOL46_001362 [Perkinsus olseni]|uniref:Uncharacterized protein n=1 Tax=Perkinsus olseni TaxID=32597 RepID=A0A7J6MD94_PEROL|nr:hypothetical protein FOL46_001362 [Perkinsus olseni]